MTRKSVSSLNPMAKKTVYFLLEGSVYTCIIVMHVFHVDIFERFVIHAPNSLISHNTLVFVGCCPLCIFHLLHDLKFTI